MENRIEKRGRGRPRSHPRKEEKVKKAVGRPRKRPIEDACEQPAAPKKPVGRPRKTNTEDNVTEEDAGPPTLATKNKGGRPRIHERFYGPKLPVGRPRKDGVVASACTATAENSVAGQAEITTFFRRKV